MILSKQNIKHIPSSTGIILPTEELFALPEKVLQFGTGVLLRGLPDYFIDKANRKGIFNGRIVVIKSTSMGDADAFGKQDNLYTVCVRGIEGGKKIEETVINSSISRVLAAKEEWKTILSCAHNPALQVVISNTTEVGITLMDDDVHANPPLSFPGKLLSFLLERYQAFNGGIDSGLVIVPTELIADNGSKLRSIVLELARMNKLDHAFIRWIETSNHFCNSLVDRIVPGKLSTPDKIATEKRFGYTDDLAIMTESFCLWAIESGNERVKKILSFSQVDEGVVIAPDIQKFRELKLRLLNGVHTFSSGLAHLAGFATVKEAMLDGDFSSYIQSLAIQEMAIAVSDEVISYDEAAHFATKVLDRFRNPYIDHAWLNITVQYSSKMKMRNIPVLQKHYNKTSQLPEQMALGFAAFLLFMKCRNNDKGQYESVVNNVSYTVQDDHAAYFAKQWNTHQAETVAEQVLADKDFWGIDLTALPGFAEAVKSNLILLMKQGVKETIHRAVLNKTEA